MKKGTEYLMELPERCEHPAAYLNAKHAAIMREYPKNIAYLIFHCEKCGSTVKVRVG